ncbi:MAG: hypothetical protein IJB69_08875 [Clostridia bacterium]|nr:hypothetical protein [Clostridia bacterium]
MKNEEFRIMVCFDQSDMCFLPLSDQFSGRNRKLFSIRKLSQPVFSEGVSEATGPPVEGAAESRRKLKESAETSNGNGSDQCDD